MLGSIPLISFVAYLPHMYAYVASWTEERLRIGEIKRQQNWGYVYVLPNKVRNKHENILGMNIAIGAISRIVWGLSYREHLSIYRVEFNSCRS